MCNFPGDTDRNAEAHDPQEGGKDKVRHRCAVPLRVTDPPIRTSATVDKHHEDNAETVEMTRIRDLLSMLTGSHPLPN